MTGGIEENGDKEQLEDDSTEETSEEEFDLAEDAVIVDETVADTRVDKLVADIDSIDSDESAHQREIRKKLEALDEKRDDEQGSTYNFNLDDDL